MSLTGPARRIRSAFSSVFIFGAVLAVALGVTSSTSRVAARGAQQQEDNGIAPSARAQIESLIREKETRSPAEQKIDSQLLYAWRMQQGLPVAPGVQTLEVDVPYAADGHVIVEVSAKALTPNLLAQLSGLSREVKETGPGQLEVHVALSQVAQIAAEDDVVFVQPRQGRFTSRVGPPPVQDWKMPRAARRAAMVNSLRTTLAARTSQSQNEIPEQETNKVGTGVGSVSSQADIVHRTAVFRALTGFNGAGVKIGVLSDGVAHLADAQASGDLGAVTVLPGQAGPSDGDEGTAMLELIHDVAPGAQLYFATAFTSVTSFGDNIRALRTAGCDIIVDDVGYFVESPFQDGQAPAVVSPTNGGYIAQAVKDVAALGAMYFSSAGNSGNLNDGTSGVWEGDFVAGGAAASIPGTPASTVGTFHRFTGAQDFNTLTIAGSGPISLAWSDPLGGSGNDYDIFRLDSAGTTVAAGSANIQNGNDDPYEQMSNSTASPRIVVVRRTGAAARFLHLNTNRGQLSVPTAGQTHGHAATSNIFTFDVAATYAGFAYPNPFSTANVVETFSSDGPRRIFFQGNGTAITPGNFLAATAGGQVLQKPDMTAADGTFVTGAGDFPGQFFGTSAAAPNAAAIMALIKSQNPGFTQTQLRSALFATALDIEGAGVDRDSGIGIVMASPPQPGCTFTLAPPTPSFASAGGAGSAAVTANTGGCNWIVFSNVPWITIAGSGVGVGNASVGYSVAANKGPARSGTIMIQGGQVATVSQAGAAATTFSSVGTTAIPDNTTVESTIPISGLTLPITNVTVSFYLTHTFDADITISLVGPDGTTIPLSTENGGSANNYGSACSPTTSRTTFDDGAANYITHGSAPFVGSFRPEKPLATFVGKSGAAANGTWKLRITDSFAGDTGLLQCWSLNINSGAIVGAVNDFDGNGTSDLTVFRPATGQWFVNAVGSAAFGLPGDIPVSGDYDGNGLADVAVYRPSTGQWFIGAGSVQWGRSGDIPVPADYDGDKRTDIAVWRATDTNTGVWAVNLPSGQVVVPFGVHGDVPMPGDYDGDGRADFGLYRPSTGQWFIAYAASGFTTTASATWGIPGDIPVRADLDNDHRLDFVVYRPSTGTWFMAPTNSAASAFQFGLPGDVPMALDTSGDGFDELVIWRPGTGTWFMRNRVTATTSSLQFGLAGDIPVGQRPRPASVPVSDFDGDGVSDITVFRPSTGTWFTRASSTGLVSSTQFGLNSDITVNSDYDGDRRSDQAIFRPSTGEWFILQSSNGIVRTAQFGLPGDKPMPADYDGDGRADLAVFRPSSGQWYILYSSNNAGAVFQWGLSTDQPFAQDFDGDGRADLAIYRPSSGQWFLFMSTTTFGQPIIRSWGLAGDVPIPADFDGDGRSEIAIFRPSTGEWLGIDALNAAGVINRQWGLPGDIPVPHDYDGDGVMDPAVFRGNGNWFIRQSSNGALLQVQLGLSSDQPR